MSVTSIRTTPRLSSWERDGAKPRPGRGRGGRRSRRVRRRPGRPCRVPRCRAGGPTRLLTFALRELSCPVWCKIPRSPRDGPSNAQSPEASVSRASRFLERTPESAAEAAGSLKKSQVRQPSGSIHPFDPLHGEKQVGRPACATKPQVKHPSRQAQELPRTPRATSSETCPDSSAGENRRSGCLSPAPERSVPGRSVT